MFLIFAFFLFISTSFASESITGRDIAYRDMCLKAAIDHAYFHIFRSLPEYTHAVEISEGLPFAEYITQNSALLNQLDSFSQLDAIGNPPVYSYPGLGLFSATTLRYIAIADQITRLFRLTEHPTIVEIGAGFGGQCYILSHLFSFSKYYIYDLPEPNALITKVMNRLDRKNVFCLATDAPLLEDSIDLFISNYALSECDKETQIDYFHRVIKKAKRGYLLYNQTSHFYSITSLTAEEFVVLLQTAGFQPQVFNEPISTFSDNLLIFWDASD